MKRLKVRPVYLKWLMFAVGLAVAAYIGHFVSGV